ncbi:hypothetical protein G3T36_08065 [Diaminobutyricibacter tongyongensis]|uniref:Uncharacterized protein n=1 Tax=Leifsonia tongyongensis TaxID=1268043 RepID=A0A6L9XX22_9MICO|nr:hypothetical protein [Diaminobutyricibacter tongyongensis]NEN05826.1 hypothetical protein [Diaminobutyricibacter tongyongensis]
MNTNDEPLGYAANIKPLFRELDRNSMLDHFDLWNYDDVVSNQDGILGHLVSGEMPCDGPWPESNVALLRRWIDKGSRP